jgi:hypothetical protein
VKFRVLILGMMVLAISFTPQASTLPLKAMLFEDLKVEALPPDRGTVIFIAQTGENPASGVEIRIDGGSKGFTGEDGKLKVEWLLFGSHVWEALYKGERVSQGEFEIEKIADVDIVDFHLERDGEIISSVYCLGADRISAVWEIKNTGTTVIDHFTWKLTTTPSVSETEIKLLQPEIPSRIFNALKGWMMSIFYSSMGREMVFKESKVTWTNIYSHKPESFKLEEPFEGEGERISTSPGFTGIQPGEVVKFREEKPYVEWTLENMDNKASEMGVEMKIDIVDGKNGIMHIWVKEYKYGLIRLKNIETMAQFKGPVKGAHQLLIDDKSCCSWDFEYEYLYDGKTIGGETIEEVLEGKGI